MAAITLRKLSPEAHRALKQRASARGLSTEAQLRSMVEDLVAPAQERVKLGTLLYEMSREFGGVDLDIRRDQTPTDAPDFE